jgi:signal transduction histidine kinase
MNFVLDFSRPPPAGVAATESLLACFQEALGHQLPNRLVAIQGLARLLESDAGAALTAEGREYLDRLAELARHTDRLVRALADVGRLCRDARSDLGADAVDVAREAAAEVSLACTGTAMGYDFPGALPRVGVSRASLRQVLVQLLANAARSGVPGRPAHVRLGGRPLGEDGTAAVEVWVADDGRGLPEVSAERLFEPSWRGGPSAAADGGLGLGLFLVRTVVASWGGGLAVESRPGQGTRVALHIPRR